MGWQWHDEEGRLRAEMNDEDRKFREWDEDGNLVTERDYTPEEVAALEQIKAAQVAEERRNTLLSSIETVIEKAYERQAQAQAVIDTPNSEINNRPAPHIVSLARVCKRQERAIIALARLVGGVLDSTDTGTD